MAWVSLALSGVFGVVGLGFRSWLHVRRTSRSPLRSGAGPAGLLAVISVTAAFTAGAVDDLVFGAPRFVNSVWLAAGGLVVAIIGLAGLVWSQSATGASLRIGVDRAELTAPVTRGPARGLRSPIYT